MSDTSSNVTQRSPRPIAAAPRQPEPETRNGHIRLFWRLLIPNACLLVVAGSLLVIAPPNGRFPIIAGGLVVMIVVNGVLMRWAFAPLERLSALMEKVDPLTPGQRLPVDGPRSEVTVLTETFNRMLDRLESERRDSARRSMVAQEDERRRVAAELHDEVGQSLTALMLGLSRAAEGDADPKAELRTAADEVSGIIEEVRGIARGLRPEALDDLGLASALNNLCEQMSARTGLDIEREISRALPEMGPETELVIYRIVQESLNNVLRHAGASSATVGVTYRAPNIVVQVIDDGCGMDTAAPPEGSGIRGMRERAVLVRGDLKLFSPPGGGTGVQLLVPCEKRA